jgi:hypothetical protein
VAHLKLFDCFNQWNVSFARAAHDWEVDVFASFYKILYSARVRRESEDKMWWVPSKRGYLRLDPSIVPWFVVKAFASLGRVFGKIKFP